MEVADYDKAAERLDSGSAKRAKLAEDPGAKPKTKPKSLPPPPPWMADFKVALSAAQKADREVAALVSKSKQLSMEGHDKVIVLEADKQSPAMAKAFLAELKVKSEHLVKAQDTFLGALSEGRHSPATAEVAATQTKSLAKETATMLMHKKGFQEFLERFEKTVTAA